MVVVVANTGVDGVLDLETVACKCWLNCATVEIVVGGARETELAGRDTGILKVGLVGSSRGRHKRTRKQCRCTWLE